MRRPCSGLCDLCYFFTGSRIYFKKAVLKALYERGIKMSDEKRKHSITMDERRRARLTGVADVLSFDENCIVADTQDGAVVLRGRDLHVSNLNLENGVLDVDGEFTGFSYEESVSGKQSFFGRIFK